MFDILSEKAGYKTMYSNILFVKTVFNVEKMTCSVCILKY